MKESEYKLLLQKYQEASSTRDEEERLLSKEVHQDSTFSSWANFVKENKAIVPNGLNEKLWNTFKRKKGERQRRRISMISVAASVFIVTMFLLNNTLGNTQSYTQKERLLQQALNMFESDEEKEIKQKVFYENDMIVVYTTSD